MWEEEICFWFIRNRLEHGAKNEKDRSEGKNMATPYYIYISRTCSSTLRSAFLVYRVESIQLSYIY